MNYKISEINYDLTHHKKDSNTTLAAVGVPQIIIDHVNEEIEESKNDPFIRTKTKKSIIVNSLVQRYQNKLKVKGIL